MRPVDDLLAQIEAYCFRTGTRETDVGAILFRHGGFVGLLRLRGSLTPEKRAAVEHLLAEHPDGLDDLPIPKQHLRRPTPENFRRKSAVEVATDLANRKNLADAAKAARRPGETIDESQRRIGGGA